MPDWVRLDGRDIALFGAGLFTMWFFLWAWHTKVANFLKRIFVLYRR